MSANAAVLDPIVDSTDASTQSPSDTASDTASDAASREAALETYLERESRGTGRRSEFYDGEIHAMSGASLQHARLVRLLTIHLASKLRGTECESFTNDVRVWTEACEAYFYPDLVVVCGEPTLRDDVRPDTLLDPRLIVEILSPSTAHVDRGLKSWCYRSIPSLDAYLVLEQDRPAGELARREDATTWLVQELEGADATVEIPALELELSLGSLYP